MSTPFYVSPQQAMADRAEYARKGIARGRSLVVLQYADGIVFVGENPSRALHKFSEIYDRIGFAAAGKYNEYENLRIGGVRYADLRGYTYDRDDVTARGLATRARIVDEKTVGVDPDLENGKALLGLRIPVVVASPFTRGNPAS